MSVKVTDCEGSMDDGASRAINMKVIPMGDNGFGTIEKAIKNSVLHIVSKYVRGEKFIK